MTITIKQGDAVEQLRTLKDGSVHCCVTSPPYYGLRDYGVDGQIGLEKTPEEYVQKIVEVFREVKRVLRDDGTLWLNLGDSYWANRAENGEMGGLGKTAKAGREQQGRAGCGIHPEIKSKDMIGIPWMVAFALRADGWYLRSDIIWSKPNPMPESVTDRPTKAHEYVFLLTKSAKYFYDADAIREPHQSDALERTLNPKHKYGKAPDSFGNGETAHQGMGANPAGRNRRTVWEIATQPTPEAHFATFPEALVEPCIKAGTSEYGCCPACGAPWKRIVEKGEPLEDQKKACGADSEGGYNGISWKHEKLLHGKTGHFHEKENKQDALGKATYTGFNARYKQQNASDVKRRILDGMKERISSWQPGCKCENNNPVPCVVLDPFGGSGTVAKVARDLKRDAILIELNPAYISIAKERLRLNEQLPVIE